MKPGVPGLRWWIGALIVLATLLASGCLAGLGVALAVLAVVLFGFQSWIESVQKLSRSFSFLYADSGAGRHFAGGSYSHCLLAGRPDPAHFI